MRAPQVRAPNLYPGPLLWPGRHGRYRSIDLVEMELFGRDAAGFGDFSVHGPAGVDRSGFQTPGGGGNCTDAFFEGLGPGGMAGSDR